jgi:ATP-binding cassette, subfamily B, bacterial
MSAKTKSLGVLSLCRWATAYALQRWMPLAGVLATMFVKVGLDVLKPWPMVFLVDYVLQDKSRPPIIAAITDWLPGTGAQNQLIGWAVAATVVIFFLSWAVGLANAYANISLGQRMVYDLAADLFSRLQQLSLRFHSNKSVGDNLRRVTADCASVSIIIKDALLPVITSLFTLAVMFCVLWRLDQTLTLLAMAVVPFMLLIFFFHAEPMLQRSNRQQEEESRIYEIVEQTFSGIPVVQAFCRENFNDQRFSRSAGATLAATISLTNLQLRFKVLIGLTTAAGTAGILWIGAHHALAGALSIGTILLFLSYLASLYEPLATVMYTSSTVQAASGSAKRVREVLETEREVVDRPSAKPLTTAYGHIRIEQVTFGYEPGRPVLRNISVEVKPAETIALVGATGAGKSTLVSLIPRFFDPWEGRVQIDDHDVRDVKLKNLRANIAICRSHFCFLCPSRRTSPTPDRERRWQKLRRPPGQPMLTILSSDCPRVTTP